MQLTNLGHHVGINSQTAGGVYQQHISKTLARFLYCRLHNVLRLLGNIRWEELDAHLGSQGFQLLDRSRTINVGTDHHDGFFL